MVLLQNGQTLTRTDTHRSLGGFDFPGEDFKERGFTGTIGPDYPITVPLGEIEVYLIE
jgi:hypothetical protein